MRAVLTLGLVTCLATPVAAQWLGMPAWNTPKGGTGLTIYGDYGGAPHHGGGGGRWGGRGAARGGTPTPPARCGPREAPRAKPTRPPRLRTARALRAAVR